VGNWFVISAFIWQGLDITPENWKFNRSFSENIATIFYLEIACKCPELDSMPWC
jgi:hypothetical protein